jgi:hypothetical protein
MPLGVVAWPSSMPAIIAEPAGSGGAPTTAQYVTLATDGTLTQERVLTAGTGITLTDGGAGGAITVAASGVFPSGIDVSGGSVTLQNDEFIRNSTNGAIDLMPDGTSASHFGLRVNTTIWGFGPQIYAVRASDGSLTAGSILFSNACVLNNDIRFAFGTAQASFLYHTLTGLDTLQLAVTSNNASYSGAVAIIQAGNQGAANRSPTTSHTHPNLYIYANGSASAADFVRIEHDLTDGRIVTGDGNLELTPATNVFVNAGYRMKRTATAVSVAAATTDYLIGVTSTAAARTITLPTAVGSAGKTYLVKDESGGAATNNITLATTGGQTIDGAASLAIATNYGVARVYSDNANWFTF